MKKKTKFILLRTTIVAMFAILAGQLWYVQVVMGGYYKVLADTSKIRYVPVPALRGIIYDRNGVILAHNVPSWEVQIVPHGIPSGRAQAIYTRLSSLLHGQPSAAWIAAQVRAYEWRPYGPAPIKERVSQDTAMIIKQLHYELPGVRAEPSSIRSYAQDAGYALSHILGYTDSIPPSVLKSFGRAYPAEHVGATDQSGAVGIESIMDPYLHGVNGREQVEVDAGERPIRILQQAQTVPGDDVYLTIDWKLQQQVSADLAAGLNHLNLRSGVAIVEDIHSGQILAMASLPSYNDNLFSGGIRQKQYSRLLNDPARPLYNLATQGQFPPGSIYKIVTAAAALQTGSATADTIIDDTGSIKLCSRYDATACQTFLGWDAAGLGPVNIVSALAKSSDIYFYTVTGGNPNRGNLPHIGADRLAHYARLFGLGARTGIDLPDEYPGLVPTTAWHQQRYGQPWHIGDSYNSAIGQGDDLTTPLQMVNVAATIANGGTLYRPRLVEKIVGRVIPRHGVTTHAHAILPFVPAPERSNFIDPANISLIQQGLHLSVTLPNFQGTGFLVQDPRIDAAGKTGTAEVHGQPPHAWWVGYAPYNHPKVAVIVMVPNAGGEGAYVSAPIAHKILEDYFHLPAKADWVNGVSATLVGSR